MSIVGGDNLILFSAGIISIRAGKEVIKLQAKPEGWDYIDLIPAILWRNGHIDYDYELVLFSLFMTIHVEGKQVEYIFRFVS
jgi:hypothetical protein